MRRLKMEDIRKRGCRYCADMRMETVVVDGSKKRCSCCPHDECPYHELDEYNTYRDYLKDHPFEKLFVK